MRSAIYTKEDILRAAEALLDEKGDIKKVTPGAVRAFLGGGSHDRIRSVLDHWIEDKEGTGDPIEATKVTAASVAERALKSVIAKAVEGSGVQIVDSVIDVVRQEVAAENASIRERLKEAEHARIEANAEADVARRTEREARKEAAELRSRVSSLEGRTYKLKSELDSKDAELRTLRPQIRDQNQLMERNRELSDKLGSAEAQMRGLQKGLAVAWWVDGCLGRLRLRKSPDKAVMTLEEWNHNADLGVLEDKDGLDEITARDIPFLESYIDPDRHMSASPVVLVRVEDENQDKGTRSLYRLSDEAVDQFHGYGVFRDTLDIFFKDAAKERRKRK